MEDELTIDKIIQRMNEPIIFEPFDWSPFPRSTALSSELWKAEKKRRERRERIQKGADIILNKLTIDYEIHKQNLKIEKIRQDSHLGLIDNLDIDARQIKSRYTAKELMYNLFYTDPQYSVFDPHAIMYK